MIWDAIPLIWRYCIVFMSLHFRYRDKVHQELHSTQSWLPMCFSARKCQVWSRQILHFDMWFRWLQYSAISNTPSIASTVFICCYSLQRDLENVWVNLFGNKLTDKIFKSPVMPCMSIKIRFISVPEKKNMESIWILSKQIKVHGRLLRTMQSHNIVNLYESIQWFISDLCKVLTLTYQDISISSVRTLWTPLNRYLQLCTRSTTQQHLGQVKKLRLSCYLVLLSVDS